MGIDMWWLCLKVTRATNIPETIGLTKKLQKESINNFIKVFREPRIPTSLVADARRFQLCYISLSYSIIVPWINSPVQQFWSRASC